MRLLLSITSLLLVVCTSTADEKVVTWNQIQALLNQRCVLCHNPQLPLGRSPGGLRLTTHADVMRVVLPGQPTKSALFTFANVGVMPEGDRPHLSEKEKDQLYFWIYHGASNNLQAVNNWQWINQNVVQIYCADCHGGESPAARLALDFSSEENYRSLAHVASEKLIAIITGQSMHPTLSLPRNRCDIFAGWLHEGAVNTQVPQANWPWINKNIIEKQCRICHTGELVKLSSYAEVLALVQPRDPDNSPLYGVVASEFMPQDIPLTDSEIDAIRDWIMAGAPP